LFDDKSDVEECNLFLKDYKEYNTTKIWFKGRDQLKEGKLQLDKNMQGESCELFQCNFFKKNFNACNCSLNKIV
jgi:hypothetical protein